MLRYVVDRSLLVIPTILGMVTLAFFLLRALPGDPAVAILGDYATEQAIANLRQELRLDDPILAQYWHFVSGLVTGDWGRSALTRQPAATQVFSVLGPSLMLSFGSLIVAIIIGIPIGVISAVKHGTWVDYTVIILAITGISFPVFWIGLISIMLFSYTIPIFPAVGGGSPGNPWSQLHALVLPALVLGSGGAAYIARLTRSAMLEVLNQDYILVSRAMGIRENRIIYRYALKNALPAILSVMAVTFAVAIGNAILVEMVFSRPGLGSLIMKATFARDYQLLQIGLLVLSVCVVLFNFLIDMLHPIFDPRIRK